MFVLAIHPTIAILILMIGAAILAFIIGYLLRGWRAEADPEGSDPQIAQLRSKIAELKARIHADSTCREQLEACKTENEELLKQSNGLKRQLAYAEQKINELETKLGAQGDLTKQVAQLKSDLAACKKDLEACQKENNGLKTQVAYAEQTIIELEEKLGIARKTVTETKTALTKEEKRAAKLAEIASKKDQIDYGIIGTALPDHKDDLKKISGIGPYIEEKLNILDILTYEQLAAFTPHIIEKVQAIIEFFPGRIERDDWVGQAKELMKHKE